METDRQTDRQTNNDTGKRLWERGEGKKEIKRQRQRQRKTDSSEWYRSIVTIIRSFRPFLQRLFKSTSTQKRSRHSTDTVLEFTPKRHGKQNNIAVSRDRQMGGRMDDMTCMVLSFNSFRDEDCLE